jgi:multiple sugar transport system substrate-binding protein
MRTGTVNAGGRRARLAVALTAVLALGLAACGGDDDADDPAADGTEEQATGDGEEPVTLRVSWWGADERHNATIAAIELFEAANPHVTIEPEFSGFDGYHDRLATQASGGNAPDVFQLDPSAVKEYAERGVLLRLDDHAGDLLSLDAIPESVSGLGRTEEGLFSLPWGLTAPILMMRPDFLYETEAPQESWTWEDFEAWASEVTEASNGDVHGTEDLGHRDDALRVWLRQRGKDFYTEDGQLGFDEGDLTEWFTMWDRMRQDGAAAPAEVTAQWDGTPENSTMANGHTTVEFGYTSVQQGFADAANTEIEAVRPPGNSETPGDYLRPSVFLSVYADTAAPEVAVQFLDFMLNDPESGMALGATRGVPPNENTRDAIRPEVSEAAVAELDYIADVGERFGPPPPMPPPGAVEIINLLRRTYEEVSFDRTEPETAAAQFFAEAEGIIGD